MAGGGGRRTCSLTSSRHRPSTVDGPPGHLSVAPGDACESAKEVFGCCGELFAAGGGAEVVGLPVVAVVGSSLSFDGHAADRVGGHLGHCSEQPVFQTCPPV